MLILGQCDGYVLTVNRSNTNRNLVTYHIFKDAEEKCFAREDCMLDRVFGPHPDDYLYTEAARLYDEMGRPEPGEWSQEDVAKVVLYEIFHVNGDNDD